MSVKALIAITIILAGTIGTGIYYFNSYLFARVITPGTKNISVKPGEALSISVGGIKENTTLRVDICTSAGIAGGCYPLTANADTDPVSVRIPIGYQTGPATIQVKEISGPAKNSRLRLSIPVNIE